MDCHSKIKNNRVKWIMLNLKCSMLCASKNETTNTDKTSFLNILLVDLGCCHKLYYTFKTDFMKIKSVLRLPS